MLQYGEKGGAIGYLVGEENKGLEIMFGMMNHARFAVGLQGLAIAERAYQQAVDYAMNRIQGAPLERSDGTPIVDHPDVLRLLSVMRAEIEAMRALILVGGAALDKSHHAEEDKKPFEDQRFSFDTHYKGLAYREVCRTHLGCGSGTWRYGLYRGNRRCPAFSRFPYPAHL